MSVRSTSNGCEQWGQVTAPTASPSVLMRSYRRCKWSNIELKRGVDTAKGLWDWRYQVESGGPDTARTDCTLELLDYDGSPIATYNIKQAWPSKYTGVSMNANSNEIAVEAITICHEGFKRM